MKTVHIHLAHVAAWPWPTIKAVDLNRRDVYVSPLGRHCMLTQSKEGNASRELFTFTYLDIPGGFSFTSPNVALLRREVRP